MRQYDCLNRITGQGLQIQYRFPRTSFQRASNMVHVELVFTNTTTNIEIFNQSNFSNRFVLFFLI